jgi:RimJ/RimL family protein N-acetyltransferase
VVAVLLTERLRLREWTTADVDFVFDMYSRWDVQRYLGQSPQVMADRSEAVAAVARWRDLPDPVHAMWAVERAEDRQLVGTMLLKSIPASSEQEPLPASGDTEIGWHFHPDAWGLGYATEAARRVLDYGFAAGLTEVVAVTYPDNAASQAVALRIGMTARGLTDHYYNTTLALFSVANPAASEPAASTAPAAGTEGKRAAGLTTTARRDGDDSPFGPEEPGWSIRLRAEDDAWVETYGYLDIPHSISQPGVDQWQQIEQIVDRGLGDNRLPLSVRRRTSRDDITPARAGTADKIRRNCPLREVILCSTHTGPAEKVRSAIIR